MTYPYIVVRDNIGECEAAQKRKTIIKEFEQIINKYSLENDSNTPDFILAEYLFDCLISANILIGARSVWYNPTNKK